MGYTKSFFRELSDLRDYVVEVHDKDLALLYKTVHRFVLDCKYSSIKSAQDIVGMLDKGTPTKLMAANLGITASTVRDKVKSTSEELYNLFGRDFFVLFKSGSADDINTCKERLFTAVNVCRSSSYYVLDELKMSLGYNPNLSYNGVDYADCKKELSFLLKYNKANLTEELEKLSKSKLKYLISLLDGKGEDTDRYSLFQALNGEV